jgi:PHD/YefM family antitoxin component YafN of YafNO toxin-antitoxin module
MQETMIDARKIYSLTDFLRNYKVHIAQLKETRTPEVLTVNGRAEVVILDTETYENMAEQLNHTGPERPVQRGMGARATTPPSN